MGSSSLYFITVLSGLALATWSLWRFLKTFKQHSIRSAVVLVLGDIGRSPRMMYHAQSFAEHDFMTDVIAYGGSKPIPALERLPKVQFHYLPQPPALSRILPFFLFAPIKILHQVASIFYVLLIQLPNLPEFILVQNPPTVPTLAIVWVVGCIWGSKVIIDWHNLGYSILALKVGEKHPFVKAATWFEKTFGRSAYAHLFVTKAMHDFLVEKWGLQGQKVILHDRPPSHFHRATLQETHDLFLSYHESLVAEPSLVDFLPKCFIPHATVLTHTIQHVNPAFPSPSLSQFSTLTSTYSELPSPSLRPDRPALLVSSTSWTPDEDFGILLEALNAYETRAELFAEKKDSEGGRERETLPKLLVIVTGKGPLRDHYMSEVEKLQKRWRWVRVVSQWLQAKDYPVLLGSADLGVCVHSSSSALDLPMKVVDMFGCQLPVCALDFACLNELVRPGINGLVFENAAQLAVQLEDLLKGFPQSRRLSDLHESLVSSSRLPSQPDHDISYGGVENDGRTSWHWGTWEENWSLHVKPLVLGHGSRR